MLAIFCYPWRVSFFQRQNYFSKHYCHVHSFRSWNQFVIVYCTLLSLRAAILNCFDGRRNSNASYIQGVSRKAKKKKWLHNHFLLLVLSAPFIFVLRGVYKIGTLSIILLGIRNSAQLYNPFFESCWLLKLGVFFMLMPLEKCVLASPSSLAHDLWERERHWEKSIRHASWRGTMRVRTHAISLVRSLREENRHGHKITSSIRNNSIDPKK